MFVAVLCCAVLALIIFNARREEISFIQSVKEWQSLIGTAFGFVGAAAVLLLGVGLQQWVVASQFSSEQSKLAKGISEEVVHIMSDLEVTGWRIGIRWDEVGDDELACNYIITDRFSAIYTSANARELLMEKISILPSEQFILFYRFYNSVFYLSRAIESLDDTDCARGSTQAREWLNASFGAVVNAYEDIRAELDLADREPVE